MKILGINQDGPVSQRCIDFQVDDAVYHVKSRDLEELIDWYIENSAPQVHEWGYRDYDGEWREISEGRNMDKDDFWEDEDGIIWALTENRELWEEGSANE